MTFNPLPPSLLRFIESAFSSKPRQGLQPIPGTQPLTLEAALCPPLLYYLALLFLAPPPPSAVATKQVGVLRNVLALLAAFLFFRLPLAYHIPQSIGLTYQLGLVGLYGGFRVLDAFFVSYYGFGHVPRRVRYTHLERVETPRKEDSSMRPWSDGGDNGILRRPSLPPPASDRGEDAEVDKAKLRSTTSPSRPLIKHVQQSDLLENMTDESFTDLMRRVLSGPNPTPVIETADTEGGWPHGFLDRAAWALELELSMRGVGFTWTTADVRHTRKTWLPTPQNRIHSIMVHVLPVLVISWAVIRGVYVQYLQPSEDRNYESPFDELVPFPVQLALTAALGAFLMTAFSLGHSIFAIMLSPLAPSPLAFFPPLYTKRIWDVTSARKFWSYGWHRLFARLFLVWGTWPGEWVERQLTGKTEEQPADLGKVLGAFISSAFVHSFAVRGTLGGDWKLASGEAKFFALNGVGVVLEELFQRAVRSWRRRWQHQAIQWYDSWVGRVWWITLLLGTGRNFARGWTKAGLVREMAFL